MNPYDYPKYLAEKKQLEEESYEINHSKEKDLGSDYGLYFATPKELEEDRGLLILSEIENQNDVLNSI